MHISKIFQKLNNQTIVGNVKIFGTERIIMLHTLHVTLRATETLIYFSHGNAECTKQYFNASMYVLIT